MYKVGISHDQVILKPRISETTTFRDLKEIASDFYSISIESLGLRSRMSEKDVPDDRKVCDSCTGISDEDIFDLVIKKQPSESETQVQTSDPK